LEIERNYSQPSYSQPPPPPPPAAEYGGYNPQPSYGGGEPNYGGGDTNTTIIREDGGWFGADKETVITTGKGNNNSTRESR
jgi:hypothetical protein